MLSGNWNVFELLRQLKILVSYNKGFLAEEILNPFRGSFMCKLLQFVAFIKLVWDGSHDPCCLQSTHPVEIRVSTGKKDKLKMECDRF